MNNVFLVLLISIFSTTNIFAEEHKQNGTNQENVLAISQNQIKVATVDFQRILRESQIGRQYLKSAKTNIDKKQKLLSKLDSQFRAMREEYDEQKLVLEEKSRDEKEEELAYKLTELKRKREDFEAEMKIADARFQRDILRVTMKEVKIVAEQLGYDIVLSASAPGLMFMSSKLDITDKVLERMSR